jgi:ABC-type spermidine/putrescine transport system permease subunit I
MTASSTTAAMGERHDLKTAYRSRLMTIAVVGPPFLYLILLFAAPLVLMLVYSFGELNGFDIVMTWTLRQYERIAREDSVHRLLFKSFRIAVETTAITILVSYPIAFTLARIVSRRWQSVLLMMVVLPSWTSFIIRTYSWLLVLGDHGLINDALKSLGLIGQPLDLSFNEFSVAVAIVYVSIPWMVLPIYVSLEKIDWSVVEAGQALGANWFDLFRRIIGPLSLPGVVAGILMVFVPAISQFAIPQILGGNGGYMFGNLVNFQFLQLDWPYGAALSVVMLVVSGVAIALAVRLTKLEALWQ